jgi:hypothetical protein
MKLKGLLLCGVLSAIVYVGTVILGGALRSDYSHLSEPISELTAAGAPNKALLDVLFTVYNVLVAAFGVGVLVKANGRMQGRIAGLALIGMGICGVLLQIFFPQDPGGAQAPVTTTGNLHIVFAGISALLGMIALLFAALWFRKQPELKGYVIYTLVTLAVVFISGLGGAIAAGSGFALFGLVERITIGALMQWLFFAGLKLASSGEPATGVDRVTAQKASAHR